MMIGKPKSIRILAGVEALAQMRDRGLHPSDIDIVTGAAGGPKWLALSHIDRFLFGEWFRERKKPLHLVGSSAGAWRLACGATSDPVSAIKRFEDHYISQQYSLRPTAAEVTATSKKIIEDFLGPKGSEQILSHPTFRLRILVNKCSGPLTTERPHMLKASMGALGLTSVAFKPLISTFIERHVGFDGRDQVPIKQSIRYQSFHLQAENLPTTLLASGSIPAVMEGVRDIAGARRGIYRDGGLLDYHIDLPFETESDGLVFCPHFIPRIIPGWFDRFAPWRQARFASKTILVVPTAEFVQKLPNGKIPCRKDFLTYAGRDSGRISAWNHAVANCSQMADELSHVLASGDIGSIAEPL